MQDCVTNDNQAAAGETLRSKNILPQVRGRVVDRRLHRSSATSRDRLHGIVDAEDVVTPRQKGFLHKAARFDTARLVVIAFCCRSGAMTEQTGRNADVGRVVNRNARDSAIPK